jgi:hypothetical protein
MPMVLRGKDRPSPVLQSRGKRPSVPSSERSLKILRRMERIEGLPLYRQRALLTTIDQFLAAADR